MASIDAFWDLASREPATKPALRLSLRHLAPPGSAIPGERAIDRRVRRQNALILVAIALLHVLMLLGLRAAMQPPQIARVHEVAPLQITFIDRRPVLVVAKPVVSPPVDPHLRVTPAPRRLVPRTDALQAVTITPRTVPMPAVAPPPKVVVSATDGEVPAAPHSAPPRDLLAHRSVDWMLPGGARKNSPDFHVRDDPSPEDAVNTAAGIVAGLIGRVAVRPDQNGIVLSAPDRGLRTSGRDSDPCDDVALDMADLNASEKQREQAGDRYQRNCQGH